MSSRVFKFPVPAVDFKAGPALATTNYEIDEFNEERGASGGLNPSNSLNSFFVRTPQLPPECLHGLAGAVVRKTEPHTETHPAAVLVQLLIGLGNLIGRSPYFLTERDRQHCNLFGVVVGNSAVGRKGTSWGHARHVLAEVDSEWEKGRILSGLASGEGVISELKDAEEGEDGAPGAKDKRLMLHESEFGAVLRVLQREGNTLSSTIRNAWDTGTLRNLANAHRGKTGQSLRASDCHISIAGHITKAELSRLLTANDAANGFANRFLWVFSDRTRLLPDGGEIWKVDFEPEINGLQTAVRLARARGEMKRTDEAREYWREIYPHLAAERPGRWGEVTSRAEAQTVRLSLLFALLDRAEKIGIEHLQAARAMWDYCCQSARWAFMESLYSPEAQRILTALERGPLTLTGIHEVMNKNTPADKIRAAVEEIKSLVVQDRRETAGKDATVFSLRRKGAA